MPSTLILQEVSTPFRRALCIQFATTLINLGTALHALSTSVLNTSCLIPQVTSTL